MRRFAVLMVMVGALAAAAGPAWAAPTRSYVSLSGTNAGNCEEDAPCKTVTYAIEKTGAGGEVVLLDSGTYRPFTANKSVEITARRGVHALISATSTYGVRVAAGKGNDVTLRNLVIRGNGQDQAGIEISSGEVEVRGVRITRFGGHGVASAVAATDDDDLSVVDSEIVRNGGTGIWTAPGVSDVVVRSSEIDRHPNHGIRVGTGARNVSVRHSRITRNAFGGIYDNDGGGSGTISVAHSEVSRNGTGQGYGIVGSWGRVIRVNDVELSRNQWALSAYGGAVMHVRDSDVSHNAWGVLFSALGGLSRGFIDNSTITHNNYGIWPEGAEVRVGRSTLAFNGSAIYLNFGGTAYSYGDNAVHNNAGGEAFTGTIPRT